MCPNDRKMNKSNSTRTPSRRVSVLCPHVDLAAITNVKQAQRVLRDESQEDVGFLQVRRPSSQRNLLFSRQSSTLRASSQFLSTGAESTQGADSGW